MNAKKYELPPSHRLRASRDFARIYAQQQRMGDRHLLIFASRNRLGHNRVGLSVSKKHGNSVRRSRKKRLLREAFRLSQHDLPQGFDLILIPRQNSESTLEDYRRSLLTLTRRLARRLKPVES